MCLSSSETISSGVICDDIGWLARRQDKNRFKLMAAELYRASQTRPLACVEQHAAELVAQVRFPYDGKHRKRR